MAASTATKTPPNLTPYAPCSSQNLPHRYLRCFRPPLIRNPYFFSTHCSPLTKSSVSRPRFGACSSISGAAMEDKALSEDKMLGLIQSGWMQVMVPPHPLIKHWISVLRNEQTPCAIFKSSMAELGRLLIYEASRDWLLTISGEIQSPTGVATVEFIDPREPVMIVPILRAGLALAEYASSVLPATKIYHLGMRRDEKTLQPSIYLNNLPNTFPEGSRILVVDPMLATGGTIAAAIDLLKTRGLKNNQIKIISAIAAPPALQKLSTKFPGLHVYTGVIDPVVNEHGFIVPGLGDAGDRCFGT